MEAKATAKFVRMAPRKVRFVLDTVRGKYVDEALAQLKFTPNHAAEEISKVIRSAAANAENNFSMNPDVLKIVRCFVDVGPTLKRVQPRAQGRAFRILKRTSHITVILEEAERPSRRAAGKTGAQKVRRQPLRAALPTPPASEAAAATTEEEVVMPVAEAAEAAETPEERVDAVEAAGAAGETGETAPAQAKTDDAEGEKKAE